MNEIMQEKTIEMLFLSISILVQLIEAVCIYLFFNSILNEKKYTCLSRNMNKMIQLLVPVCYFSIKIILKLIPAVLDAFLVYFLIITAVFLISFLAYSGNIVVRCYVSVTFFALSWLSHYITICLCAVMEKTIMAVNHNVFKSQATLFLDGRVGLLLFSGILDLVLRLILILVPVTLIARCFRGRNYSFSLKEIAFLLLPSIGGILNVFCINRFLMIFQNAAKSSMFDYNNYLYIAIILNGIVSVLGIIVIVFLFKSLEERKEKEKNYYLLENQIRSTEEHIKEIEQVYLEIRGFKHDMKNHVSNIGIMLRNHQFGEAEKYVSSMSENINVFDYEYQTGNPITDAIINQKAITLKQKNIEFINKFVFPENTRIDVFDLGIILNNALDNAIEACGRKPEHQTGQRVYISIGSIRENNAYLLKITNIFFQPIYFDALGELPLTSKKDKKSHGLGLQNIRIVAKKYYGDIDIEIKDNIFILTVMLMCH